MVKIHKGVCRPQLITKFFPGHFFARSFQQGSQHTKGLILKADLHPPFSQLACAEVHFELTQTEKRWNGRGHGRA